MFIDDLTDYLTKQMASHKYFIICEDFTYISRTLVTLKHKY